MKNRLSLSVYIRYGLTILTAGALFISVAGLSPANASPKTDPETTITATVEGKTVTNETETGDIGLTLPGALIEQPQVSLSDVPKEYREATTETPLVNTKLFHSAISSYETEDGTQTLIRIESDQAAKEYRFPLSLPKGATAEIIADGSVLIYDAEGETLGGYKVPWATDANGEQVPTRFTLEGATLVQTVDFTERTAFPVVADPNSWWGWTQCAAAIGFFVASNGLAATRIAKIGGIAKLISRLQKLKSSEKILAELVSFFGEFFAIDNIINKCR